MKKAKFRVITPAIYETLVENGTIDKATLYLVNTTGSLQEEDFIEDAELYVGTCKVTEGKLAMAFSVIAQALCTTDKKVEALVHKDSVQLLIKMILELSDKKAFMQAIDDIFTRKGSDNPYGAKLLPRYIGDKYLCTTGAEAGYYIALGMDATSWVCIQSFSV